jgi:hypothetical protein
MPFQFTRYLYIKEEVRCALLCAILSRHKEEALFWASELYCSGYQEETLGLLWEIYYDFYATLNPSFETYLIRKCSDSSLTCHALIVTIITNICLKPYTTDVYALRQMVLGVSESKIDLGAVFAEQDFKTLATYILGKPMTQQVMQDIQHAAMKWCGTQKYKKMRKQTHTSCKVSDRRRFLSHIIQIFTLKVYDVPRKNRLNISDRFIDKKASITDFVEDIFDRVSTLSSKKFSEFSRTFRARNILKVGCKYHINVSGFLPLFDLQRYKIGDEVLQNRYRSEWLYYASSTPFWATRIAKYGGIVEKGGPKNQVVFSSDDLSKEETFYELYGVEPDEQPKNIQDACIAPICRELQGAKIFCDRFGDLNIFGYGDSLFETCGIVY